MNLKLKYGHEELSFEVPEQLVLLKHKEPEYLIDKDEFIRNFSELLPSEKERYCNVSIVVSDKTRLCGYPEILPWIIECLNGFVADSSCITFYIAYGTHAHQSEEESFYSYGDVYKKYRFIHHVCSDKSLFITRGRTTSGTPVSIRNDIIESSLLITIGAISHHYFAGFGGGRKLLFPGLAEKKAIYFNHGLYLDKESRTLAKGCQPGIAKANPIYDDLMEIDSFMPKRISIHGILDSSGKLCQLLAGNTNESFKESCRIQDIYFKSRNQEQFDLVIASCGGYPKDINFIQAHKAIHNASAFVKEGGKLIMLSECIDGIGSDFFMKYFRFGSFNIAFSALESNYEGNGGTALAMMLKTKRIQILMLTALDEKDCNLLSVKKIKGKGITDLIAQEKGSLAVITNASMLVK